MQYIVHVQPEVSSRTYNQPANVDSELFVEYWRFDPCSNFDLQYFCQSSIEIPMPTPKSNLSILCCKILVQQVLQLRLDKRIAMEGWQKYSKGGLPRRLPGKPPLEHFCQPSIAMLRSILNCNTCWTGVLQQRIDKSIATLLWPLLTSLHIYPHYCFTVHVVHCICNLQTITASTLQRVWRLGTQESGLMRCACVELLDNCWK